jgi:hypothetical protein
VKEAVEKIESKEKISLKKVEILAQKINIKSQDVKVSFHSSFRENLLLDMKMARL